MVDLEGKLTTNENGRPVTVVRNAQDNDIDTELTVYHGDNRVLTAAPIDDPDALSEGETAYGKYDLEPGETARIPLPMKALKNGEYEFWGESDAEPFYRAVVEDGVVVREELDVISDRALRRRVRPGGPPSVTAVSHQADELEDRLTRLTEEQARLAERKAQLERENEEIRKERDEMRERLREREREVERARSEGQVDSGAKLLTEALQLVFGRRWWRGILQVLQGDGV